MTNILEVLKKAYKCIFFVISIKYNKSGVNHLVVFIVYYKFNSLLQFIFLESIDITKFEPY